MSKRQDMKGRVEPAPATAKRRTPFKERILFALAIWGAALSTFTAYQQWQEWRDARVRLHATMRVVIKASGSNGPNTTLQATVTNTGQKVIVLQRAATFVVADFTAQRTEPLRGCLCDDGDILGPPIVLSPGAQVIARYAAPKVDRVVGPNLTYGLILEDQDGRTLSTPQALGKRDGIGQEAAELLLAQDLPYAKTLSVGDMELYVSSPGSGVNMKAPGPNL